MTLSIACHKDSKQEKRDTAEADFSKSFLTFAATHDAIVDWKASLPDGALTGAYSIHVENALVRPDKRPIAVTAYLEDIVRRNDHVFLEFSDLDGLYLILEATPEVVQQVKRSSRVQ